MGLARELRGFSAGLAWGLIFFALRVASRQNTFDSNIAMPVLYRLMYILEICCRGSTVAELSKLMYVED